MSIPAFILAAALALQPQSPATTEDITTVSSFQLLPFLKDPAASDASLRSHLDVIVTISSEDMPISEARFWFDSGDGTLVPLPLTDSGQLQWEEYADQLADDVEVKIDRPKEARMSMSLSLQPKLDLGTEVSGVDIRLAVSQANAAIKRQAGLLSVVAPRMKGVSFSVPNGSTATLKLTNGQTIERTALQGAIEVTRSKRQLQRLDTIRFDAAPTNDRFTN